MINPFKNKKGLGRGLSSLIGDSDIKSSNDKISISSIIPNKNQPRKIFEKEALEDLKRKILQVAFNKKELTYLECKWQFVLEVLETNKYLNDNILGKFYDRDFR